MKRQRHTLAQGLGDFERDLKSGIIKSWMTEKILRDAMKLTDKKHTEEYMRGYIAAARSAGILPPASKGE